MKRALSAFMFVLLLASTLTFAFNTRNVKASGTIYIRADGSIDPPTAPIQRDGDYYTLTGNITVSSYEYGIVIERNNMTLDGAGYTVQGTGTASFGIVYESSDNVTIRNTNINNLARGIVLYSSSNNSILVNNITNNELGIVFGESSNNNISENSITANSAYGIYLGDSSNNSISGNNITNNGEGVGLNSYSCNNTISGNNITNNELGIDVEISSNYNSVVGNNITNNSHEGIYLCLSASNSILVNNIANNDLGIEIYDSSNNSMFHNYFINNTRQIYDHSWEKPYTASINFWDDGYPSGGNYWSDHTSADIYYGQYQNETGSDGIGDVPYIIDGNNRDHYPLMRSYVPFENQTIYIRADGSVDPSGAPIWRQGDFYTLTNNVTSATDGIVIERDNIALDGAGYTLHGAAVFDINGIALSYRSNVTIKNTGIRGFWYGIFVDSSINSYVNGSNIAASGQIGIMLSSSSNNSINGNTVTATNPTGIRLGGSSNNNVISGNSITNNAYGIELYGSSSNAIVGNNVTNNWGGGGIWLLYSSNDNNVSGNNITANYLCGIWITESSNNNSIVGNSITANNGCGMGLQASSNNSIYHNNFVDNTQQVYLSGSENYQNIWNGGYPSGGNYWSGYAGADLHSGPYQNETGGDGMGDTPYVIDLDNQDNYPLMNPWPSGWKLDFVGPTNHPIVDFAVYDGSLYAAADNTLYAYNGGSWNATSAPTFITSLEPYEDKLIVGGQSGLYCYDGTTFAQIFSVPTYIKVLGVYNNTLYAGTMLDNPPRLYYCNGSADNPSDWHIDTGFSDALSFNGNFGSIDSFAVFNSNVDNPVGFWRLNEGSGATAYDSSGNGNDGTIYGASWITGVAGNGLGFDGDDLVQIPDSSDLNPSEITVETWVSFGRLAYGGGYSGTDNQMLVCKGGWPIVGSYRLWQGGPNSSFQILFFDLGAGGPGTYVGSPELTLQTNRWYHIAGTYDGNVIKLYLDGVLQASRNIGSVPVGNAEPLYFGYHDETGWNYYLSGSLDEVTICNYARTAEEIWNDYSLGTGKMYVASGSSVYCYDGANWSIAVSYDDVSAFLAMKAYNGKLYLATRDQGWRKPLYQGGTGFSGRVIEFDGENWTTVLDHDYWIYSLETYDNKLYAGTANKILTYNGTHWETSFNATEGAYYAISMITLDGKIYVGMGNGYIFVDPAPPKPNLEVTAVPEFPSATILAVLVALTIPAVVLIKRKRPKRLN